VASWNKIIDPPEGVSSARQSFFMMVDQVEALETPCCTRT